MSVHFSYLRDVVFRPIEFHRRELRKLEENKQRAADDDTGDFAYVSELREEIVRIQGVPRRVRRVFVTAPDAPAYEGVGWILADDMDLCMVCNRTFSMFFDPLIHCHACGSVVCGKCMHLAVVQEIKKLGPVPVCRYCDWGQVSNTTDFRGLRSELHYFFSRHECRIPSMWSTLLRICARSYLCRSGHPNMKVRQLCLLAILHLTGVTVLMLYLSSRATDHPRYQSLELRHRAAPRLHPRLRNPNPARK